MKPEFWQGVINITQVPRISHDMQNEISWLYNPFGDDRVYMTQFGLEKENFSWKYFLKEDTKEEALTSAHQFLSNLRERFSGIDGKVSAKKITIEDLDKEVSLRELILPEPEFQNDKKLSIIKKIFDIFYFNFEDVINFYIIWQADDSKSSDLTKNDLYKVKIFFNVQSRSNKNSAQLEGHLRNLASDIENVRGDKAYLRNAPSATWRNILTKEVFFKNLEEDHTGKYYRRLKRLNLIPQYLIPGFIKPEEIDFSILESNPIIKAVRLPHENVGFGPSEEDKSKSMEEIRLFLGYYIDKYGVITKTEKTVALNDLTHHIFITGLTGLGKTSLIAHFVKEIAHKAPHVGVLVILLGKESDKKLFNCDLKFEYPNLEIPYFFPHEILAKRSYINSLEEDLHWSAIIRLIRENANILTHALGLSGVFVKNMNTIEKSYFKKYMSTPASLKSLLQMLYGYFKKFKYPGDFGGTSLLAINNRISDLLSNNDLENVVKLSSNIPFWFEELLKGKNILLDLTTCDKSAHMLLINLIFQMLKIFIPDKGGSALKYLVVIDEIGEIGKQSRTNDFSDDNFVVQSQIGEIFSEFLQSFRSRGIGGMISGHDAVTLSRSFYSEPNISILFSIKQDSGSLFTKYIEGQETFSILGRRKAFYKNSITTEEFMFYTPDFNPNIAEEY